MCHQSKFLKETWDLTYKDGCETARDYKSKLSLIAQTSIQRHMHEHINKDGKMQRNEESQTRWHEENKASMLSHKVEG